MNTTGAASGDLLRVLVENSADAISLLNADGTVRFSTPGATRLHGYTLEERVGQSAFELLHPDDVAAARESFRSCLSRPGVPIRIEYRVRHKDGSWRFIEAIGVNRLDDPTVAAIVLNTRDMTERRLTEAALRDSEERLRHIVEHAQDLIYYCDPSGHFTYVNPTAERVMQFRRDELLGRHFMTLIRDDYKHAAAAVYAKQLLEQSPSTYFEFPAITKDGESVWVGQHVQLVRQNGAVVAVHAIARDITPQKLAEERLRASESKYRSLIERAAFGIYRSTETGRILETNEALVRMLGYDSADELKATNMAALYVNPEDRHALIEQHRGQSGGSSELRWKRKDGTPILVRLTARTIEGGFEGRDYYETIAEDITGRKALEDQLRQAQKMEAVGRLARGVAHDFNNVLAAIIGYSELITMRLKPGNISSQDALEIRKAAERGASLTRRLLTFSRSHRTDARIVDLHAFVRDDENMLQRLVGTGVVLQIDTPGDPPRVLIEPGQLEQILLNLLVNARDATPDGGAIDVTISAVAVGVAERVRYPDITAGMYGRIRVRDTGSGIAPDMQAHVFEPFFTTKDPEKGTGLGLSIVYGIAKDAGGTVTFSTAQDEGTTFDVLLPAV